MKKNPGSSSHTIMQQVVDIALRLGILFLLLAWTFEIIKPFISIVIWGIIIAVSLYPAHRFLINKFGERPKLSAFIISLALLSVLIIPTVIFTDSMVDGLQSLSAGISKDGFTVPPPDESVAKWPLVGDFVYDTWYQASDNLEALLTNYSGQLKSVGNWILSALMGTGLGLVQLLISIVIGGIFLATSKKGAVFALKLFRRMVGSRGDEFARASEITVRNVSKGVIGVAIIQSFLAGLVFTAAGIPYAGLWTLLAFIFCIIQVGPGLIIIPVIVYIFTIYDTWIAILWTIALILVMISDNIIKPMLMGKGAPVPMLVIFIGSLGGFFALGFIGLFLGAIILSLVYKLFLTWIEGEEDTDLKLKL